MLRSRGRAKPAHERAALALPTSLDSQKFRHKKQRSRGSLFFMAERARFELAVSCPTLVFKTSTLNHSVTSPTVVAKTIVTDTERLVESLAANCNDPHRFSSTTHESPGRIFHRRTRCHDVVKQNVGYIRIQ